MKSEKKVKTFMVKVLIAKYEMVEVEAETEDQAMEQAETEVYNSNEDLVNDDFMIEAQEAEKI